ncbi:barstar family protein [Methanococcus maripaludis]|uniref:Barstar (barnase inhibitor) domain-containing protein n=1 Tax=Methanococcus maripaludis TaxID=39152 RepID=A0A7J9PW62_METMI|nr:barstar family protein [Methanococcus maripaludis]MBA2853974.1 hypothetical protein [Methanococcus maripaludis]MBA2860893.1 hypothetical protein [Methanococcus maripaludis]MBA2868910.1 hypothetical protein [Methanococcus maripaludis]
MRDKNSKKLLNWDFKKQLQTIRPIRNVKIKQCDYLHFLFCDNSQLDEFIEKIPKNNDKYIAKIAGKRCSDLDGLFSEFKRAFKFPDYFGYNWAAFDECLNDLDWISADSYLLVIEDMDKILVNDSANFESFLKYLFNTALEWINGRNYDDFLTKKTPFDIYFHSNEKSSSDIVKRIFETSVSTTRPIDEKMIDLKILEKYLDLEISKDELGELSQGFAPVKYHGSIEVHKEHLIHLLEKYLKKEISDNDFVDWVNFIWFSEWYTYFEEDSDLIASVMNELEEIDEEGKELTVEKAELYINVLKNNIEV